MSVPAVVALAASLAARDHQGIIGYRIHRTSAISATFFHRSDDVQMAVAYDGDRLLGLRVLSDLVNGRPATPDAMRQLEKQLADGQKQYAFAAPFDARHFGDYRYTVDGSRVHFISAVRDVQHGDGSFTVNAAGAVTALDYVPAVLPKYATSGSVSEQRAQVLPGFWATAQSIESFSGRYGLLRGKAQFVTSESDFARFKSESDASGWLEAERA